MTDDIGPGRAPADPPAPTVRPPEAGEPPLAILIDYDGTISLTDVTDMVMVEHVPGVWEEASALYDAGGMGSRRLMAWEMSLVEADPAALLETAARQPHDPSFVPFVRRAQAAGIPIEIVSDGFGFFIEPALAALGVPELPVVTARTTFRGRRPSIAFPNGHPACFVCGTCKRERVLAYRAAGRRVLFIGDGESDRYAAGYSDIVFAKRSLERICLEAGWPFHRWTAFSEIETWLVDLLATWRADADHPGPGPARRTASERLLLRPGGLGRGPRRSTAAVLAAGTSRRSDDAAAVGSSRHRAAWIVPPGAVSPSVPSARTRRTAPSHA